MSESALSIERCRRRRWPPEWKLPWTGGIRFSSRCKISLLYTREISRLGRATSHIKSPLKDGVVFSTFRITNWITLLISIAQIAIESAGETRQSLVFFCFYMSEYMSFSKESRIYAVFRTFFAVSKTACPEFEPLCPCQRKKSANPLVSRVCGLFHINFRERSQCTKQHKTTCKNKKKVVKRLSEVFASKKVGAEMPHLQPRRNRRG